LLRNGGRDQASANAAREAAKERVYSEVPANSTGVSKSWSGWTLLGIGISSRQRSDESVTYANGAYPAAATRGLLRVFLKSTGALTRWTRGGSSVCPTTFA